MVLNNCIIKFPEKIFNKTKGDKNDLNQKAVHFFGIENYNSGHKKQSISAVQGIYRIIFDNASVGMLFLSGDMTVTLANKEFEELTGYSRDQVEGRMTWKDLIAHEDDIDRIKDIQRLRRTKPNLAPEEYDTILRTRDGDLLNVIIRVTLIPGTIYSMVSLVDITKRVAAEKALIESEEKFSKIFMTTPESIAISRLTDGLNIDVNKGFEEITGWRRDEAIGRTSSELNLWINPSGWDIMLDELKAGEEVISREIQFKHKDDTAHIGIYSARTLKIEDEEYVIFVLQDITDHRRLEEEHRKLEEHLYHAEKMDAIGKLAGGLGHDFNNILMGIQANTSIMQMEHNPEDPHYQRLTRIEEHIKRGANLTRQLLGFVRETKADVKTVSINGLIRKSAGFFIETRKDIEANFELQDDIDPIEADLGQLEQVLFNIYINAGHAMHEGGCLHIRTVNVTLPEKEAKAFNISQGNYVKISITDTGTGMDDETLNRIFEPFFTTKSKHGGTGLGLASAYAIIHNHGGIIDVHSAPRHGSTFNIYLPSSGKKIEREEKIFGRKVLYGTGGILVVDDESMILDTMSDLLKILGYTIYKAASGNEAVFTYRENKDRIDLVILDMILPSMNGSYVLKMLRDINPDVKIILSSGYGMQDKVRNVMEMGCQCFIQKPYDLEDLSDIIHKVILNRK